MISDKDRVLVVAAHPDDEVLGMGGTLLKHYRDGDEISVIFMSDGVTGRDVKYDPQIGILGLGISVTLTRPGYSIRKRSKHKASVGKAHVITNQEAKDYLTKEYGVTIV